MGKSKICMITTGGTIASKNDGGGLHPVLDAQEICSLVPELSDVCELDCVELFQLDSSNLRPEHWLGIARKVAELREKYDGFVVVHGTDTMAYTGAALSVMLENIDRPVVLTGSMKPLAEEGSDGRGNLLAACKAAAEGRCGVFLAFDGRIIWGQNAKKVYSESRGAFLSIHRKPAGYMSGKNLTWTMEKRPPRGGFVLHDRIEPKVQVLTLVPGTSPAMLETLIQGGAKGIIIEAFGAGGVPTEVGYDFVPVLKKAHDIGIPVVITTQCLYNGVNLSAYEVGVRAGEAGALSGGGMTLEEITARLMVYLGEGKSLEEIREIFSREA